MKRAVVVGVDQLIRGRLTEIADSIGLTITFVNELADAKRELSSPGCIGIVDGSWELRQRPGVLRQVADVGHAAGNEIICVCPHQDTEMKQRAHLSRVDEVFSLFEVRSRVRDYLHREAQD